ncbi:MAG: hypothetical protein Q7T79_00220 [bacterium]|nr:hypothetical protein [bacterium]
MTDLNLDHVWTHFEGKKINEQLEESSQKQENKRETAKKLAEAEIAWWKAHHRGKKEEIIKNMAKVFSLQYPNISDEKAIMAANLKCEAAEYHDKAEKYEDEKDEEQSNIYWKKAEECLQRHFEVLEELE